MRFTLQRLLWHVGTLSDKNLPAANLQLDWNHFRNKTAFDQVKESGLLDNKVDNK